MTCVAVTHYDHSLDVYHGCAVLRVPRPYVHPTVHRAPCGLLHGSIRPLLPQTMGDLLQEHLGFAPLALLLCPDPVLPVCISVRGWLLDLLVPRDMR